MYFGTFSSFNVCNFSSGGVWSIYQRAELPSTMGKPARSASRQKYGKKDDLGGSACFIAGVSYLRMRFCLLYLMNLRINNTIVQALHERSNTKIEETGL